MSTDIYIHKDQRTRSRSKILWQTCEVGIQVVYLEMEATLYQTPEDTRQVGVMQSHESGQEAQRIVDWGSIPGRNGAAQSH